MLRPVPSLRTIRPGSHGRDSDIRYPTCSHLSHHLSPLATPDGKLFHPHFTDEEMEAQGMSEVLPGYTASGLQNGDRSPNLETSMSSFL